MGRGGAGLAAPAAGLAKKEVLPVPAVVPPALRAARFRRQMYWKIGSVSSSKVIGFQSFRGAPTWHRHVKGEAGPAPVHFAAGPADGRGLFHFDLLPHARAGGAVESEVVQVRGSGQFERRVAFLLQLDAANGPRQQAQRHELEFIAVLHVTGEGSRIDLRADAEEIRIRLRELLGRER